MGELDRRERRAVDSVATRTATHGDDEVTWLGIFFGAIAWNQSDVATKYEWIAQVTLIKANGAIDRRDSHAVSVIAHAGDDPFHDPLRMQHAGGQPVVGKVEGRETKYVRIRNRLGAKPRAHRIP